VKSVILDENIPRRLGSRLFGHRVTTVAEQGWGGVKNGRLMALIWQTIRGLRGVGSSLEQPTAIEFVSAITGAKRR
jgi:hypothetical protein